MQSRELFRRGAEWIKRWPIVWTNRLKDLHLLQEYLDALGEGLREKSNGIRSRGETGDTKAPFELFRCVSQVTVDLR